MRALFTAKSAPDAKQYQQSDVRKLRPSSEKLGSRTSDCIESPEAKKKEWYIEPLPSMNHQFTANGALSLFFPPNMLSSMLQRPFSY